MKLKMSFFILCTVFCIAIFREGWYLSTIQKVSVAMTVGSTRGRAPVEMLLKFIVLV
jgi:hypothetical protein